MGCTTSDLDDKPSIRTDKYQWTSHGLSDAYVGGKKYIFYKTKQHQRILVLLSWIRSFDILSDSMSLSTDKLIGCISQFFRHSHSDHESEGNPHETLVVDTNTVVVLPSNGLRVYKFKSIHIKPYGVLTATKWIDCDYRHNIGGCLRVDCSGSIRIDKHGVVNMNGAGMTGLEDDNVLLQYAGYRTQMDTTRGGGDECDGIKSMKSMSDEFKSDDSKSDDSDSNDSDDEKAEELSHCNSYRDIERPDLYQFDTFCIPKGGSYIMGNGPHSDRFKIYEGGCGGGCITLRCFDFMNKGVVMANGATKPKRVTRDRQRVEKLKYFARNGRSEKRKIKVMDIGCDGDGGLITIHVSNDFVNLGWIEAVKYGQIVVVQRGRDKEHEGFVETKKLKFGKCRPFPKARGAELRQIPLDQLL